MKEKKDVFDFAKDYKQTLKKASAMKKKPANIVPRTRTKKTVQVTQEKEQITVSFTLAQLTDILMLHLEGKRIGPELLEVPKDADQLTISWEGPKSDTEHGEYSIADFDLSRINISWLIDPIEEKKGS